jgi:DNA-binding NtrC family response regulator
MSMQTRQISHIYENLTDYFIEVPDIHIQKILPDFLTIGRDNSNSIPLKDPFSSSRHCRIEKKGTQFVIKDLRSRNGTFVNGTQILEATLKHGDRIQIGQTHLIVKSETKAYPKTKMSSKNPTYQKQLESLPLIAQSDFPVLILGPTGSGKELLAEEIHNLSTRNLESKVILNCSAFTPNLVESQLFGHIMGSFTGATKDRKGAFLEAHEGTLFLDEIGDLPLDIQPKLLRALEYGEITPVGSDKAVKVDVRIIAATHKDLNQLVNEGKFREDLLYRLKTFVITPPSLTDRLEDFETIIFQLAKEFRVRFSHNAILKLKSMRWPGNVRQLRQTVQRASVLFQAKTIEPEHIEFIIDDDKLKIQKSLEELIKPKNSDTSQPILKQVEKEIIIERLIANKGNQRQTAKELGIAKSTLHDKVKAYRQELEA